MKKLWAVCSMVCLSMASLALAEESADIVSVMQFVGPVTWRVGDHMEYQISIQFIGKYGTLTSDVTKEEGNAVWLRQHSVLPPKDDVQEMLVNRSDGKVIKYIQNGQEQPYTDNPVQFISQSDESVTVPAGVFHSKHVVGKTIKGTPIDIWQNSEATAIDGMLKTVIAGGSSIELVRFVRGQ